MYEQTQTQAHPFMLKDVDGCELRMHLPMYIVFKRNIRRFSSILFSERVKGLNVCGLSEEAVDRRESLCIVLFATIENVC